MEGGESTAVHMIIRRFIIYPRVEHIILVHDILLYTCTYCCWVHASLLFEAQELPSYPSLQRSLGKGKPEIAQMKEELRISWCLFWAEEWEAERLLVLFLLGRVPRLWFEIYHSFSVYNLLLLPPHSRLIFSLCNGNISCLYDWIYSYSATLRKERDTYLSLFAF